MLHLPLALLLLLGPSPALAVRGEPVSPDSLPAGACELRYEAEVPGAPAAAAWLRVASCAGVAVDEASLPEESTREESESRFLLTAGHCTAATVRAQLSHNFLAYLRLPSGLKARHELNGLFSRLSGADALRLRTRVACPSPRGALEAGVAAEFTHPSYRFQPENPEPFSPYELTLLRLSAPLPLRPARIATLAAVTARPVSLACVAAGAGLDNQHQKGTLSFARIDVPYGLRSERGELEGKRYLQREGARFDAGVGDSGGPLFCPGEGGFLLYGVTSIVGMEEEAQAVGEGTLARVRAGIFGPPTALVRSYRAAVPGAQLAFFREGFARLR